MMKTNERARAMRSVVGFGVLMTIPLLSAVAQGSGPRTMEAATTTSQQGRAGANVATAPAVRVLDKHGAGYAGASVTFTVTAGGGSISPSVQISQSDGIARLSSWTLGQNSGVNKVVASISGLSPVEFVATSPFTLLVLTKRADGVSIPESQICVGSRTDGDQFASVKSGGTYGRATFSVPAAVEYGVTASKAGFTGQKSYMNPSGSSGSIVVTLPAGSGGAICPGAAIQADATTSIALPPDPMPDLDVDVTQSGNPVIGGTRQTYTVRVYNKGTKSAGAIAVKNSISSNLDFLSASADKGFVCARSGTEVNCSSGTLAAGEYGTITIATWLSSGASSGHDIIFGSRADPANTIPELNETNNLASAATVSQAGPALLGEEVLPSRGMFSPSPGTMKQLDCKQFGNSFVMVGVKGKQGEAVGELQLLCASMKAPGFLESGSVPTAAWDDNNDGGTAFSRPCPTGQVVTGVSVTVNHDKDPAVDNQMRSLTLQCKAIGVSGLTSGSAVSLAPIGTPTASSLGPDSCTQGRPARGMVLSAEFMLPGFSLTVPWIIVGERLICSQPVVP